VTQEQSSPDELRDLAEQIVKTILDDEELIGTLGDQLVLGRKKCPKKHKCIRDTFTCPRPFYCPKMHSIVWVPK
jgi:hypothetical protein